ncbi:hypothetical protein CLV63_1247 [Murinocardiopsis flavida]|uniref:Uncharacterized protein n=1 Tax=Murinocardiopsis flavida TaxID=645275 RepID=A0A2P8CY66_9ACTN|nr:lipoprotein [Murinocardiopsis flavida]PSK89903.1 hypothetical protein CLV63_1247 [Murinocardiopsis flavida]
MRRIACVLGLALLLSGCSSQLPDEAPSEQEPVRVDVLVATKSGKIGQNHDDVYCLWKGTTYVLRNGNDETVATGDADSWHSIEAKVGGESAEPGEVASEDPYRCEMQFSIDDVSAAEFYELTVTTQEPAGIEEFTETVTFSRDEIEPTNPIEVEFTK